MIKISKKLAGCYLNCLPKLPRRQFEIELVAMVKNGKLTRLQTTEAMSCRVSDLENTVKIQYME